MIIHVQIVYLISNKSNNINKIDNYSNFKVKEDQYNVGQGWLKCEDILGASPAKFNRGRKLFIDRNEVKSILGQSPGKYHGFANDFLKGGTYKAEEENNTIVSDYKNLAKNKLANRFSKINDDLYDSQKGNLINKCFLYYF